VHAQPAAARPLCPSGLEDQLARQSRVTVLNCAEATPPSFLALNQAPQREAKKFFDMSTPQTSDLECRAS
jgi:hypothetical protein